MYKRDIKSSVDVYYTEYATIDNGTTTPGDSMGTGNDARGGDFNVEVFGGERMSFSHILITRHIMNYGG